MGNRLSKEKSPYLLQHAENPVDWYPWGQEAFDKAEELDLPIFLSIGYATCHWCHVMEKESFRDQKIADMMNQSFVCIKLDREEMPEVDNLYMEFAQALMSSGGGWPLNIILTPEKKPFFATTYLPAEYHHGMMGLKELIAHVSEMWKGEERELLGEQGDKIVELFQEATKIQGEELPTLDVLNDAIAVFFEVVDPIYGGIQGAPKFPIGYHLSFLLNFARTHSDSRALFYVDLCLEKMRRGGIFDHLGGGFARYSVDERWEIPHFEKMLYDNAILLESYLDGYLALGKKEHKETAVSIAEFIMREMRDENGSFYSAKDADSEGQEGLFYVWSFEELEQLLPESDFAHFVAYYGVTPEGNFSGKNVLFEPFEIEEFCKVSGLSEQELRGILLRCKELLFATREKREKPFLDDKVLTAWNALAIQALARSSVVCSRPEWMQAAKEAMRFLEEHLIIDGKLQKRYRDGEAGLIAGLDDYAFTIRALITLYELGAGQHYLERAVELTTVLEKEFKAEGGAYYLTTHEDTTMLIRKCEFYDGALPTGNAVHAENLLRLFAITGNELYEKAAEDILKASKLFIESYPPGTAYFLKALLLLLSKNAGTVSFNADASLDVREKLVSLIANHFNPHLTTVWKEGNLTPEAFAHYSIGGAAQEKFDTYDALEERLT
ncbi:MAG: hypothetical protein SP1CHLAM54_06460 [Chlamydiia bacterium]|nr:hypothetical protein [Chlamydiia bacterium]MCH9615556.1 hypothetical protein [Chlamydiia bacterium]MCH9629211.1 hypothetical protein [Chlamydiia bacterium]